jgi:putative CocE/NonD family hydrolase
MRIWKIVIVLLMALGPVVLAVTEDAKDLKAEYIRENYAKYEFEIPMRDGITLFTKVFIPYDKSQTYPILLLRSPYGGWHGADIYMPWIGPSSYFEREGFIFVLQNVRGRFRSEGTFVDMRPQDAHRKGPEAVDDATDTWDTIDWLVNNIPGNNGRVGIWGQSSDGYYATVGSINSHEALKAIAPEAPIADLFFDDFHRNGAFALSMGFLFLDTFDHFPEGKHSYSPDALDLPTHDGYQFFLDLGPLSNVNRKYFHGERPFWNEMIAHPNYDEFWQSRNILQYIGDTLPETLIVGGWYDTEDLYGPLMTYKTMSRNNTKENVRIVMGPWRHGQWSKDKEGSQMGEADNGFDTSKWFQERVYLPFFKEHLKGGEESGLARATMFDTGADRWQRFEQWPPKTIEDKVLYLNSGQTLSSQKPAKDGGYSEYISDPNKPVPQSKFIEDIVTNSWDPEYMTEDQRFAARRPDVLLFETEPLGKDQTLAGDIAINFYFSTSQTAADLVVKLVDVFPSKDENTNKLDLETGNRHELVRWGVIRGRFRNSMSKPEPFEPGKATQVAFELYDVFHTFKRGHKLQILIQSSMFPFLDRNPQKYVENIFKAEPEDFVKAVHRIYHDVNYPSRITVHELPE